VGGHRGFEQGLEVRIRLDMLVPQAWVLTRLPMLAAVARGGIPEEENPVDRSEVHF